MKAKLERLEVFLTPHGQMSDSLTIVQSTGASPRGRVILYSALNASVLFLLCFFFLLSFFPDDIRGFKGERVILEYKCHIFVYLNVRFGVIKIIVNFKTEN